MTDNTTAPGGEELYAILVKLVDKTFGLHSLKDKEVTKTKAQVQAYILAEVQELIGTEYPPSVHNLGKYQKKLKAAAIARFGKGGTA